MSFILDALKKSESDRQRQSGPALFEVKVAPPRSRLPVWVVAIAGLLLINMVIVGWLLFRKTARDEEISRTSTQPAQASLANVTSGPPVPAANAAPAAPLTASTAAYAPPGQAANQQGATASFAPAPAPATSPAPVSQQQANGGYPTMPTQSASPNMSAGMSGTRMPERAAGEPTLAENPAPPAEATSAESPDDYAPAADPGSSLFKGHVKRGTASGVTLYQDAAIAPGSSLPQLRLDLHVYAAKPQDRFVLVNMHKLHEGDSLQDGTHVDSITPDGVVMSHNGTQFLLPRE